jgi:hypothetical protein
MCNIMHTKQVQGKSQVCVIMSTWMPWNIESPSHPRQIHLEAMSSLEKLVYLAMASKTTVLMLSQVAPTSTLLNVNKIWNALLIFHHINVDANPLLCIDNGDLICTNNNIINFWNARHHLWKDHIMNGLYNLPAVVIWPCFNGVFFTFSNKNNFPQWFIFQYGSTMQENVQHNVNWMNSF